MITFHTSFNTADCPQYEDALYPQHCIDSCLRLGIKPIVIGDTKWKGAENVQILAKLHLVFEFRKHYNHRSCNAQWFEMACLERWLYIRDYVRQNNISRFMHIDTDVLLLETPENIATRHDSYVLATTSLSLPGWYTLGQCIMNADQLDILCERIESRSCLNDMSAFSELVRENAVQVVDMGIPYLGSAMDHHVCDVFGWKSTEDRNGFPRKLLSMGGGRCSAFNLKNGETRLLNLHCWYLYKNSMKKWLERIYS